MLPQLPRLLDLFSFETEPFDGQQTTSKRSSGVLVAFAHSLDISIRDPLQLPSCLLSFSLAHEVDKPLPAFLRVTRSTNSTLTFSPHDDRCPSRKPHEPPGNSSIIYRRTQFIVIPLHIPNSLTRRTPPINGIIHNTTHNHNNSA